MMSFSGDTYFARSIPTIIASYSVSLLNVGKSSCMACYIFPPVRDLSCKLTPTPVWRETPSTLKIHQSAPSWSTSGWGSFAKKFVPSMLDEVYFEYRIFLVQSPTIPSFMIGQACV